MPNMHEGKLDARGKKVAIVAGRFNDFVTHRLVQQSHVGRHLQGGCKRHRQATPLGAVEPAQHRATEVHGLGRRDPAIEAQAQCDAVVVGHAGHAAHAHRA